MSRRWWWPAAVLLVAAITAGSILAGRDTRLVIGGQVVPAEELSTYAAAHSLDLRTKDGRRAAVNGMTRFKAVQEQAHERGLIGYVDYAGFRRDLDQKHQQPGYGVMSYDPSSYLSYLESNLELGLRRALVAERRITPTETQLRAFYSAHKGEYARKTDTMQLTVRSGSNTQQLRIDDANAYAYSKYHSELFTAVQGLAVGQTATVAGDIAGQVVVTCTGRSPGGYKTLAQVRPELTERYTDQEFQRYLDAITAATPVEEK